MRRALLVVRRAAVLALLAVVLVRPSWGSEEVSGDQTALSVVVAVDRTTSMRALDVGSGARIDRARADVRALVDALPGARFALVSFATGSALEVPMTSDAEAVAQAVDGLELEQPVNALGSRLDRPLADVARVVRAAERADPERRVVLVMVSDGENTEPGAQASYAALGRRIGGGVVLGYGSATGGRMPLAGEGDLSQGFVVDASTGSDAVSRLDEANLQRVADELRVPYVHRDRPAGMEAVIERLEASDPTQDATVVADRDLTWVAALALLALLLLELRRSWTAFLVVLRDGKAAR